MSDKNYTLRDWGYFKLLQMVAEGLESEDLKYALVGGGATQARIVDLFYRNDGLAVPNIPGVEFLLRKTKDLDITSHSDYADFVSLFNHLQAESSQRLSVNPKGNKRAVLTYNGRKSSEPVVVSINYQTGAQDFSGLDNRFYNECIETAEDLEIVYNNEVARVRVATPESIVTSKLTRNSPKDIVDISNLLKVIKRYSGTFDDALVREHLRRVGKENCFEMLDQIVDEVLRE